MINTYFAYHIEYITSFLHLSLQEVKKRLCRHPVYLVEYIAENEHKMFIESPLQIAQTYLICCFDEENMCDFIILHPEETELVKDYLSQFITNYDFIKSRWTLDNCKMEVEEQEDKLILIFCE